MGDVFTFEKPRFGFGFLKQEYLPVMKDL